MIIDVCDLAKNQILSGSESGKRLFKELVACLPEQSDASESPAVIFLDFISIEVATASFLRESVMQFKSFTRATKSGWYPVIANANNTVVDDLKLICDAQSDVILSCTLADFKAIEPIIIGSLESKQSEAFHFVYNNGCVSAKQLMDATISNSDRQLSPTAWNNRLNTLVEKGVVFEHGSNRQKLYSAILEF